MTISLEHVRSHETDAQFTAKIVAVELSSGRDRNIYFAPQDALALKACCGNGERLFADLSALNPAQLTALLQGLREEYNVCTVNAVSYDVYMAEGTFQNTGIVFALIAGIMLVVSLLLIANMLSVMISDKRHEIGILRANGMGAKTICRIYLVKVLLIGVIAFVLVTAFAFFAAWFLNFGMTFGAAVDPLHAVQWLAYEWPTALISLGLSVLLLVLIALIPLRKINRLAPVDAIRA